VCILIHRGDKGRGEREGVSLASQLARSKFSSFLPEKYHVTFSSKSPNQLFYILPTEVKDWVTRWIEL
jgi:hypothetical protein